MASNAHSTPVPEQQDWWTNPVNPLPPSASMAWQDLWQSVCRLHSNAGAALFHAYEAGVDPEQFCGIQLAGWTGEPPQAYPVISIGPDVWRSCRRFGPNGEVDPILGGAQ